jgi:hypothetical protein
MSKARAFKSNAWAFKSKAWAFKSKAWAFESKAWAFKSKAWAFKSKAWAFGSDYRGVGDTFLDPPQVDSPMVDSLNVAMASGRHGIRFRPQEHQRTLRNWWKRSRRDACLPVVCLSSLDLAQAANHLDGIPIGKDFLPWRHNVCLR